MAERKRTGLDWQDVQIFLALGRRASLSAAGRLLGVNHATIARRMRSLERTLGLKLVQRRPDGYELTGDGARVLAIASDMAASAERIPRVGYEMPRGLVRINAPPALTLGFIAPRLPAMASKFTALDIELTTDLRIISLERHEADITIRVVPPHDSDLIARPLTTIHVGFYASPETCRRVEDGAHPTFIGFDETNATMPDAKWLAQNFPRSRVGFRTSNHYLQAMAAQAGAGVALLPHYIARGLEGLQRCQVQAEAPQREAWIMTRRRDRNDVLIRMVAKYIMDLFIEERALFLP